MNRLLPICLLLLSLGVVAADAERIENVQKSATAAVERQNANSTAVAATTGMRSPLLQPSLQPTTPSEEAMKDPDTRAAYLSSQRAYYAYEANAYPFRAQVFEWQLLTTRLIFVVVLMLVACGIYFAFVQFRLAMKAAEQAAKKGPSSPGAEEPKPPSLASKFSLSPEGVSVDSSVLGVVILTISLAFFFLYIRYVYPITDAL